MPSFAERIQARIQAGGSAPYIHGSSNNTVGDSPDLQRVLALPRRPPLPCAPPEFGDSLRRADVPTRNLILWPQQTWALWELSQTGGLVAAIPAGKGKEAVSLLVPTVLESKRPVLVVPSSLRTQLLDKDWPLWASEYRIHPGIQVITLDELSSPRRPTLLFDLEPDALVVNEAHRTTNLEGARVRRLLEFLLARPAVRYVAMSGSFMSDDAVADLRHHLIFALRHRAPTPMDPQVARSWSEALDSKPQFRSKPGALMRLCEPGESVNAGYRRRLVETPGVISMAESVVYTPDGHAIEISFHERPLKVPAVVTQALGKLTGTWTTPDGLELNHITEVASYSLQLSAGFYYQLTWPRGEPVPLRERWIEARNAWNRETRRFLATRSRRGLDSPGLYERAVIAGRVKSRTYAAWAEVEPLAKPGHRTVWLDTFLVDDAIAWGAEHRGLVWYDFQAVAGAIARQTEWQHLSRGKTGTQTLSALVLDTKREYELNSRPVFASRASRGTGTDGLQRLYSTQLFTTPFAHPRSWEQVLARLYREGQRSPRVDCYVYRHTVAYRAALSSALSRVRHVEQTSPASKQLLTKAVFNFPIPLQESPNASAANPAP